MKASALSVHQSFDNKTILIVGGTGFIGKVWLSFLLDYVPKIKKIYILVRPDKNNNDGYTRFYEIYKENSPVFNNIRNKYGQTLDENSYLEILTGDANKLNFNLQKDKIEILQNEVDLVVNFAADLRFFAPLDSMIRNNVDSALNISDFILKSKKAKLLHTSTCYVAGVADGIVPEKVISTISPNGTHFSAHEEYRWSLQECEAARSRQALDEELKQIGVRRAERLGWPNTYTFTKALGEILLTEKLPKKRITIFRPSIVESSLHFPFPGWNEDFNGTAPFIQMLSSRYRLLVAKPHHNLDVIPVDFVAKGLTIAASALIKEQHLPVYHSSTSEINPLSVECASNYICKYYKNFEKRTLSSLFLPYPKPKFITPKHLLSGASLKKGEKLFSLVCEKLNVTKNSNIDKIVSNIKRKAKTLDTIMKIYKPFIYDYNYIFKSENLHSHKILEKEFEYSPEEINWDNYWKEVHIPGLNQWCISKVKSLSSKQKFHSNQ